MYGPLILVNSALADSAWIEAEIEKIKNGEPNMGEEEQEGTIRYVK